MNILDYRGLGLIDAKALNAGQHGKQNRRWSVPKSHQTRDFFVCSKSGATDDALARHQDSLSYPKRSFKEDYTG